MLGIAIRILLLGLVLLAVVILLTVKVINRDWKSVRRTLLVALLLAIPLWVLSRPVNPPESRFHPSALAEWNTTLPPGTPVLRTGQSIDEAERVLGCPPGKYGNPEYVTFAQNRLPHPMDHRPLEQDLVGTTHRVWEDDTVIIDCTFDEEERLLRWDSTSKLIVFWRNLYVIQVCRWLGLE
ncbi:MAG: hypothetical protein ACK5UC_00675 [Planctomycetaceae bacterium]